MNALHGGDVAVLSPGNIVVCTYNEADSATGLVITADYAGPIGCRIRLRVVRLRTRQIELWWGDDGDFAVVLGVTTTSTCPQRHQT